MNKMDLQTPAIILNLDTLENNIRACQEVCTLNKKALWPMVKTHKSTRIIEMQMAAGAAGMLCGTLDEAEACAEAGITSIMYAYPIASKESIGRAIALSKKCDFILRLDDPTGALLINEAALAADAVISYTIIIDCGLHRFGITPESAVKFADALKPMKGLRFRGISTHPGQIYGCTTKEEINACKTDEFVEIQTAVSALRKAGYQLDLITTGSTPTFPKEIKHPSVTTVHPGNYVFNDVIQMSLAAAKEEDCALTVLATVISHPRENVYLIDAGAKCLGLDKGAHGNDSIVGFGKVKGHPELMVQSLSEEVGKLHVNGNTSLQVGDKIEIIPNHACSTANLTSYYACERHGEIVEWIEVDIRGNSLPQKIALHPHSAE